MISTRLFIAFAIMYISKAQQLRNLIASTWDFMDSPSQVNVLVAGSLAGKAFDAKVKELGRGRCNKLGLPHVTQIGWVTLRHTLNHKPRQNALHTRDKARDTFMN